MLLLFFALAYVCELFHYVLLFSLKWIIIISIAYSCTNCFVIPIVNFFSTNPPQNRVGNCYVFLKQCDAVQLGFNL